MEKLTFLRGYGVAAVGVGAAIAAAWTLGPLFACVLLTVIAIKQYCHKGAALVVAVSGTLVIFALPGSAIPFDSLGWLRVVMFMLATAAAIFIIPNRSVSHGQPLDERSRRIETYDFSSEAIPGFFWTAYPNGDLAYVSPSLLEYTGTTMEQVKADRWLVVHPEDAMRRRVGWEQGRYILGPNEDKIRFRGRDGTYRYFHVRSEPARNAEGDVVLLSSILVDIDNQQRAEEALRQSEQKLRRIIDTMPILLCTSAPTGEPTYENKRVLDYSGRSLEEALELKWNNFIHPDDVEKTGSAFSRSIQTGEPYEVIHRLRRADGEYRWHHSRGDALRDQEQHVIQWYNVAFDIDEGKRAEDELRSMQMKLSRASQVATVAELSASIAHELNQPLTAVVTNAETCRKWLAGDAPNVGRAQRSIDRIIRDSDAAAGIVRRLRALFKQTTPARFPLQINEVVDEVRKLLQDEIERKGILLRVDLAEHLPLVSADRIQIQQVLVNLVRNAEEAMERVSDHSKSITIRSRHVDARLVIEVCDYGHGLQDNDRIFEPFYTTKDNGMGVGLGISRSIIQIHEGQLWARPNEPQGAIFSFTLPVLEGVDDDAKSTENICSR